MKLDLVDTCLPQEDIDRGIAAAKEFFDKHFIIPDIVYQHVIAEAEGRPYIDGFIWLWEKANQIALNAAYQGKQPNNGTMLILRDYKEYRQMA